jgi:hemophore-related protein
MITARQAGRAMSASIGAGAVAGALLVGMAPSALAAPPNCTAADLAGVAAGVSAATSAYLFVRPDVNDFFTGLEGTPRDTLRESVQQYLDEVPLWRDGTMPRLSREPATMLGRIELRP